jgi:disulfide bond formation protein DsbB
MEYISRLIASTLVLLVDIKLVTDGILLLIDPSWSWWQAKKTFYARHAPKLAFVVALTSVAGSLFFSEIIGWPPCELCWWQRIFMYSAATVLGYSLLNQEGSIGLRYAAVLSAPGVLLSSYHVVLHQFERLVPEVTCGAGEISCSLSYFVSYGYITIPTMALTGFLAILALYWVSGREIS